MPKKIDRRTANELSGLERKEKASESGAGKLDPDDAPKETLGQDTNKENIDETNINPVPYVPGDLTDEKHRAPSHYDLAANRFCKQDVELPKGFPNTRDDFSIPEREPGPDTSKEVEDFYALHKDMVNTEKNSPKESKKERLLSPILAAISNFNLAKRLHKENLEHYPLPDTITDKTYRKMQIQRDDTAAGLVLPDKNYATAVGWKAFPGYTPTRCTKLKVFRPKTCSHIRDFPDNESVSSFDKKWRFIRQSKVTPMDLAICWDLMPEDPKDEPKRTTHIDGSNGSAAPAVFSLVHTPKDDDEDTERKQCDGVHGCDQIFNHGTKGDNPKDFFFDRPKTSGSRSRDSVKSDSTASKSKHRAKSAGNLNEIEKASTSTQSKASVKTRAKSAYNLQEKALTKPKDSNNNAVRNHHQSTPNLSEADKCSDKHCGQLNRRLCVACELKHIPSCEKRPKSDYKFAFKAGVPQKIKTRRHDYPDHWRLATVYQHSYKPIQARKRTLLQTVFK